MPPSPTIFCHLWDRQIIPSSLNFSGDKLVQVDFTKIPETFPLREYYTYRNKQQFESEVWYLCSGRSRTSRLNLTNYCQLWKQIWGFRLSRWKMTSSRIASSWCFSLSVGFNSTSWKKYLSELNVWFCGRR